MGTDRLDSWNFPGLNVPGGVVVERYDFKVIGKKPLSLSKRIMFQVLRYLLAGAFLYITYLGFTLRNFPVPSKSPAPPVARQIAPAKN
jgi:hypothetical protein